MHTQDKFIKYLYIGIVTIIYAICLYMLGRNLAFDTLTYDEAGQFFISKGLNHYSAPNSPTGNILDVIVQNQHYNRDPGGFSILLHLWSMISCNIIWLRLLPFLFFIGAIIFTGLTVFEVTHRKLMAYTSGLLLMALWGGELPYCLRAYSMELCGMAYGLWIIYRLRQPKSISKTALYSIALAIFITARYTIIIFGAIYGIACIISIWTCQRDISVRKRILRIIIFGLPLLISVIYSYVFAMRIQNPNTEPMDYVVYLYTHNWPFKLIIAGIIFIIATYKWQKTPMRLLTIICIVINTAFIILGYFKLLPWDLIGIKGNCFVWLWYISVFSCGVELARNILSKRIMLNYAFLAATLFFICWSNSSTRFLYPMTLKSENIAEALDNIIVPTQQTIMVNLDMSPSVRYIFEYGCLKSDHRLSYPTDFIFLSGHKHSEWNKEKTIMREKYTILDQCPINTYLITMDSPTNKTFPPSYKPVGHHNKYPIIFIKN